MRLLLSLIGAAALVAVGWICWRATAESREWREYVALGAKAKRNDTERGRFLTLGQRLFPDQGNFRTEAMTILSGPGGQRRILAVFVSGERGARNTRLFVLDEDGTRRSWCPIRRGPCGVGCRPAEDGGAWAFDIEELTPGAPRLIRYVLVDDRPVLVSRGDKE